MDKLIERFRAHPASVGETYCEHLGVALSFGAALLAAGLACLVHAFFPFLFTTTARRAIADLHRRVVTHRDRRPEAGKTA
ncbi:MAG: capsule biosynthesis protein [Burkholderiales bacterium]|nr:capsule biosynthesis protein [Burkholderiales bacterium]